MAIVGSDSVLALSVGQLAASLRQGKVTAVEVLRIYKERAISIHAACNCVVHWCPDAEEEAMKADEYLQRTGQALGPLHGVPCSIKDHYNVRGIPWGFNMITVKRRVRPDKYDHPMVAALRSLGAIPFVKTNMSQMAATIGGGGPADGDTLNPWDTLRTTSGSSAGEGALLAGCGSAFGIGSDIGGSLRLPSAVCGICTLKPTTGRLTYDDTRLPGEYSIPFTAGVMAKTAQDVALVYSDLFSDKLWYAEPGNFRIPPIPFNHTVFGSRQPLRIGYFVDECAYPVPCPTARRAVEEVVQGLKSRGHEVVPFRPATEGGLDVADMMGCDGSFYLTENPLWTKKRHPEGKSDKLTPDALPPPAWPLPAWANHPDEQAHPDFIASHSPFHEEFTLKDTTHGVYDHRGSSIGYSSLMARRDKIRHRFYRAWRKAGLDLLICPTVPFPAVHVEDARHVQKTFVYTRLFNFMDMPAGHVTTTQVTAEDLAVGYDPRCADLNLNQAARRALQDAEGLPMGVAVAALPWQEELCLRGMCEVEEAQPFLGVHLKLAPVPRRSPTLGARPELLSNQSLPQARL